MGNSGKVKSSGRWAIKDSARHLVGRSRSSDNREQPGGPDREVASALPRDGRVDAGTPGWWRLNKGCDSLGEWTSVGATLGWLSHLKGVRAHL